MKTSVIIPLHNQSKYWPKVLMGLTKQSVRPDVVYVIVDRPKMDIGPLRGSGEPENEDWDCLEAIKTENNKYPDLNIQIRIISGVPDNITRKSGGNIFLAGMARNVGVEAAIHDDCDIFIFIDGDCIPEPDLVQAHIKKCNVDLPVLSIGRRKEQRYRWMDQREVISSISHLNMFRPDGIVINNNELIKQCLIVWSCNIAMNIKTVNRIKNFNRRYYERSELFHSAFLGAWGGEDSFLGIEAWFCRIYISTVGDIKSGVLHINHPRPETTHNIAHKDFFMKQCDKLSKIHKIKPLNLAFFTQL
jgi:GT2 family glycosyltransferase